MPTNINKLLVVIDSIESDEGEYIGEKDVWEEVLIVDFLDTPANVNAMMVPVFDVSLAMFAILNVVWILVGFGFSWWGFRFELNGWGFGLGLGSDVSGFGIVDRFVGLVGEVEWAECTEVDKVEEEGDEYVIGFED